MRCRFKSLYRSRSLKFANTFPSLTKELDCIRWIFSLSSPMAAANILMPLAAYSFLIPRRSASASVP